MITSRSRSRSGSSSGSRRSSGKGKSSGLALGTGSYTTAVTVQSAVLAHGFTGVDESVHTTFDEFLFSFACGTIDAALLVARGRKTIQPEDFASLAKLNIMLSTPLPATRSSRQSGGTTNTGSYYSPGDAIDHTAYLYDGNYSAGGHGGSTTNVGDDSARSGLLYHSISGGSSKRAWSIPSESLSRLLREYRIRFNTDLRVTDPAKLYMRNMLQANMDAVLHRASGKFGGRSKTMRLTSTALKRAREGHVLVLALA